MHWGSTNPGSAPMRRWPENLAFYPRLGYREDDRRVEAGFVHVYFSKRI